MNIKNWIKIAEDDINAAEWNLQGNQYLWCIFMCQQAIEKTLKAIYQFKKHKIPPFKHDLIFLTKSADIIDECSEEIIELFAYLNIHYIETRYSEKRDELKVNLTRNNTQVTLEDTKRIFEWLKSKLPE
jgi:HEPN domain-containing protein